MSERSMDLDTLESAKNVFRAMKANADGALEQVSFDEMAAVASEGGNSIAIIIAHLHGNMLSRWTDFLTSDGEKPWRDRDMEFNPPRVNSKARLIVLWEEGWKCLFRAIDALSPADLARTITIRGQAHTVVEALHRQLFHYGYHVGQIVLLAKMARGAEWKNLSIARGESKDYRPSGKLGEARMKDEE